MVGKTAAASHNATGSELKGGRLLALLLLSTVLGGVPPFGGDEAQAQQAANETVSFQIPAQPLSSAIDAFIRQSGWQISYSSALVRGKTSPGVSGNLAPGAALQRLVAGTGISISIGTLGSAALVDPAGTAVDLAENGSVMLGTIVISGGSAFWDGSADTVYSTPGAVAHISGETLENYQITNPSDIFKGTTGVLSGEGRNSGSLDVNIHGMQGQGRVGVTVDGAENAAVVYQGYQGMSDRTFVDPDFISSVAINKNSDEAQGAIGGSVAISTITVDDIVKPGERSGFRLKFSAWGNTTDPQLGRKPAMSGDSHNGYYRGPSTRRPSFLNPTAGSVSLSYGLKTTWMDLVVGYARRDSGNFHAGSHGPSAFNTEDPKNPARFINGGLSPYFSGEEVLNTSSATESGLIKARFHISESLSWQLGYSHYDTTFGEISASGQAGVIPPISGWPLDQRRLSNITLGSATSRLRYRPEGNPFVDLSWNVWSTRIDHRRVDSETENKMWGTDLSNMFRFSTGFGDVALKLGASWKSEDTRPTDGNLMARDGTRDEAAVFAKADWVVSDRLSLTGGLRYTHYSSEDRIAHGGRRDRIEDEAFGGSFGASWKANEWLTVYGNYQDSSRLPSIFETVSFGVVGYMPIKPERARSIDIGVNAALENMFSSGDALSFKVGYFDKRIDDYIVRYPQNAAWLYFKNIDHARFRGVDLNASYQRGGFNAAISATYYSGFDFCPTSDTCDNNTLPADYSTNHVPPKFQIGLDVSHAFLGDKLTLGGRFMRVGPRAARTDTVISGAQPLVEPVKWSPYTTVDLYARYKVNDDVSLAVDISNITDTYFIDPLALKTTPGPGRTARISLAGC